MFDEALAARVEPGDASVVESGAGVNKRFQAFDSDAVMLVPPSLDEWLPQNHLARFIAEIVSCELDLTRFYDSYAKTKGQPPYDPRLMVRVLLYGYCVGVRSSRELERACVDVVAFRRLAARQAPDFRSIGRFRKRHLAALGNVFLQSTIRKGGSQPQQRPPTKKAPGAHTTEFCAHSEAHRWDSNCIPTPANTGNSRKHTQSRLLRRQS